MKKRIIACLCLVILVCTVLLSAMGTGDNPILIAINDNIPELTGETIPIQVGSVIYVPYTIFNYSMTGIDLGVYSGQGSGTVTLYNRDATLIFDINGGYAYDSTGTTYNYQAISRNGRAYVPVRALSEFFGLEYSYLSTDYGPLVRIKGGEYWLSDRTFVQIADSTISSRLEQYWQTQSTPTPTTTTTTTTTMPPTAPPAVTPTTPVNVVDIYLSCLVNDGTQLDGILDTMDQYGATSIFFFHPENLSQYDDIIRRMVGSGHQIGLIVDEETAEEATAALQVGNEFLFLMARQTTYIVFVDGEDTLRTTLTESGWVCWLENVDGLTYNRSTATLTQNILAAVNDKENFARILMDDSVTGAATFKSLLSTLNNGRLYTLRSPLDTLFVDPLF